MDNVVYLDYKAKELDNLRSGKKTMIIRGATGRKLPMAEFSKMIHSTSLRTKATVLLRQKLGLRMSSTRNR